MLGVTGPNEYENNVNNNWYTNYIARWCLRYTAENVERIEKENPDLFAIKSEALNFTGKELGDWKHIADKIYLPEHHDMGIFLQQDGFMDKRLNPFLSCLKKIPQSIKTGPGIEYYVHVISNKLMYFRGFTFSKKILI